MKKASQPVLPALGALILTLSASACGDGADGEDSGGGSQDGGGSEDAGTDGSSDAGDTSTPADTSTAGDTASNGENALFTDTPDCQPTEIGSARVKLEGSMGTFSVNYEKAPVTSDLGAGSLNTLELGGMMQVVPIDLRWSGGLQPGELHALTGSSLVLPDASTGGAGPHCIVAGEIASTPADRQPSAGALIHFRISKVRKRSASNGGGMCEGPELDADLVGSIHDMIGSC